MSQHDLQVALATTASRCWRVTATAPVSQRLVSLAATQQPSLASLATVYVDSFYASTREYCSNFKSYLH